MSVITRNSVESIAKAETNVQIIRWSKESPLASLNELKDVDAIINLAGESIGKRRWTDAVKKEILNSRIKTTEAIVTAINSRAILPKVLINASAVGYYGPHNDEEITETEEAGEDFLAQVCREWEKEAYKAQSNVTKVATIRTGVVLGNEGALNRMAMPFKFYLGGPLGEAMALIHIKDLTRLIRFVIEARSMPGPINAVAPESLPMKDFCKILGKVMDRPSWLPVPETLLKLALGQMAEMLLHSQRVVPRKAIDAGFVCQFPALESALLYLIDILQKRDEA